MTRTEILDNIITILDYGEKDCLETGDRLAYFINKCWYAEYDLPNSILMQVCAFRIPRNFSNEIYERLGL